MKKIDLNKDWLFYYSTMMFSLPGVNIEKQRVTLPHDFIINLPRKKDGEAANGYFNEGRGIYEKEITVPLEWLGKRVLLDIDGAYMNAEVLFNNELVCMHPYGYTPFLIDLSEYVHEGINKLVISTQSYGSSSRWYNGGGLYRSVSLWVGEPIGIEPWDIFVTTPSVDTEHALIEARLALVNKTGRRSGCSVDVEIVDKVGKVVARTSRNMGTISCGKTETRFVFTIDRPELWDLNDPVLYTLKTVVTADGQEPEYSQVTFGIRKYELVLGKGLHLNGRPLKLKGGCIHHDHGFLGAAAYYRAEERKIRILKAAGYNAVRISHYPPSESMLEVCDREGMILLDEAFDVWRQGKVLKDYHLYFEDWWERDIESMVLRDRNHPCVFSYSIGNEIPERDGSGDGYAWAVKIADKIRSLDSSHFITSAINGTFDQEAFERAVKEAGGPDKVNIHNLRREFIRKDNWAEKTAPFAACLDIVGYNYMYQRYEEDKKTFPTRMMMGTESHPFNTYDYWKATMENEHVIGDFVWTAFDNLGEAGVGRIVWGTDEKDRPFLGPYPWRSCFQGDMDLCGYRTAKSYYREIMWEAFDGRSDKVAMFTVHPCHFNEPFWGTGWHWEDAHDNWNYDDIWIGKPVQVFVYADADEVQLYLNGEKKAEAKPIKLKAMAEIPYEKGVLEAVAFRDGIEIGRTSLRATFKPCSIMATADRSVIQANGNDLAYVEITVVDEEGNRVTDSTLMIKATITGSGRLAGIGSGNPCTEEDYAGSSCKTYEGRALLAIVSDAPGEIQVSISADGLKGALMMLTAE